MKAAHGQRQEAAQLRREEKIRADKERLMNEDDPDKARKLEVRLDLFCALCVLFWGGRGGFVVGCVLNWYECQW